MWLSKLDELFSTHDAFAWVQRWSIGGDPYLRHYRDLRFDRHKANGQSADNPIHPERVLTEASSGPHPVHDTPLTEALDRLFLKLGPPPDRIKSMDVPVQSGGGMN
ncbi:hypothetical protein [Microbispora hainanensis]|uniref:Uncharacterized protein n=1 Tax=Microbispora hainanensis TaxID=568844 RepID=A0A544YVC2_9ACTN|nr:hypothetical protein [Microbispora hainanensis]TQS20708.1 hypothetical protein FLX08_14595 [Microbispora hainanensis]